MLAAHAWITRHIHDVAVASQALALGVWACPPGRVDLLGNVHLNEGWINLLRTRWPELLPTLRAGHPAHLVSGIQALPVAAPADGLLGVLLVVGLPSRRVPAPELLERFRRDLAPVLGAPLLPSTFDMLLTPAGEIDRPGGLRHLQRRVLAWLLARHGGNVTRTARVLDEPRQTLESRAARLGVERAAPLHLRTLAPATLRGTALEMEREMCGLLMDLCRGDARLAAVALQVTPASWLAYLESLGIRVELRRPPVGGHLNLPRRVPATSATARRRA